MGHSRHWSQIEVSENGTIEKNGKEKSKTQYVAVILRHIS